jgi:hypothetical protein
MCSVPMYSWLQPLGLLVRQGHDLAGAIGEAFKHACIPFRAHVPFRPVSLQGRPLRSCASVPGRPAPWTIPVSVLPAGSMRPNVDRGSSRSPSPAVETSDPHESDPAARAVPDRPRVQIPAATRRLASER